VKISRLLTLSAIASTVVLSSSSILAAEIEESLDYSIARGGRLYDKWFKENDTEAPKIVNPAYPDEGKSKGDKAADWRCKECHGWDYLGKEGAYREGSHFTGIKGIQAASSMKPDEIAKILGDKNHGYTGEMLSDKDVQDLANFVTQGQIDMATYIDSATKEVKGDAKKGQAYYQTVCGGCHGLDGRSMEDVILGEVALDNPWEVLHKIRNGQPEEEMTALRAFDVQISVDTLKYVQSLPTEKKENAKEKSHKH
jgi:mono/diheme cytochrome c family protein